MGKGQVCFRACIFRGVDAITRPKDDRQRPFPLTTPYQLAHTAELYPSTTEMYERVTQCGICINADGFL